MAEEKLQYTLTLATKASGTGAAETAAAVGKVATAADKATAASAALVAMQNKAAAQIAKQDKLAAATDNAGKSLGKMGGLANQASYQIGDFFTQVEMGTSVTRAFSQQAPQLIGAISSAGMMSAKAAMMFAGVGAAIPLLTMALPMVTGMFSDTAKSANDSVKDIGDAVKKAVDSIAALDTARIDEANRKISQATQDAITMGKTYGETEAAEGKATSAALDNAGKLAEANKIITEQLGYQVDRYGEIEQAAATQAAARAETARQAAEAETAREVAAAKELWAIAQVQGDKEVAVIARRKELEIATAGLEVLRQQDALYRKMAVTGSSADRHAGAAMAEALQRPLSGQENLVTGRQKALESAENTAAATRADFDAAVKMTNDISAAVAVSLDTLETTLAADDTVAKAKEVEAQAKAMSEQLTGFLDQVTPQTAAAAATVETLRTLTNDHQVTANEMDTLARNFTVLIGGMQTGIQATNANLATIIPMMNQFQVQAAAHQAELLRLAREQQRLGNLTGSPLPAR